IPQSRAASSRLKPSSTIAMARMRAACLASPDRLAAARKSAALISIRVIATPAISRPRESMQTTSIHITGPKGIPLGESRLLADGIIAIEAHEGVEVHEEAGRKADRGHEKSRCLYRSITCEGPDKYGYASNHQLGDQSRCTDQK